MNLIKTARDLESHILNNKPVGLYWNMATGKIPVGNSGL